MNIVGPCLSPVSFAVQKYHPKKKNKERITVDSSNITVNPMITRKIVYSPPLTRRLKRKRSQLDDSYESGGLFMLDRKIHENDVSLPPASKKQKIEHTISPISIGKRVNVRFGPKKDDYVKAAVILTEKFGTLVIIKEEKTNLPQIPLFSKHWAHWRGEVLDEDPILDVIYTDKI